MFAGACVSGRIKIANSITGLFALLSSPGAAQIWLLPDHCNLGVLAVTNGRPYLHSSGAVFVRLRRSDAPAPSHDVVGSSRSISVREPRPFPAGSGHYLFRP